MQNDEGHKSGGVEAGAARVDVASMRAGRELDELVCKTLGMPGREEWYASADGGMSSWFSDRYRATVEQQIARVSEQYPGGWAANSTLHSITYWPRVSQDMGAAWPVFIRGLEATGTAVIRADMEDYGRGMFTRGEADGVVSVTVGDWTVTAPPAEAVCKAVLLTLAEGAPPLAPAPTPPEMGQ